MKQYFIGILLLLSSQFLEAKDFSLFAGSINDLSSADTNSKRCQIDTAITTISSKLPQYVAGVQAKMERYQQRLTHSTAKTLKRLAKWEVRIKQSIEKVNPELAKHLFSESAMSFQRMLSEWDELVVNRRPGSAYDAYTDNLGSTLHYLQTSQNSPQLQNAISTYRSLDSQQMRMAVLKKMMRERKTQLINAVIKAGTSNKYVQKMQKESFYFAETIRNYSDLFSDEKGWEEKVLSSLKNNPNFQTFCAKNSVLAGLFPNQANSGLPVDQGLQSRQALTEMLVQKAGGNLEQLKKAAGPGLTEAQEQFRSLKNKAKDLQGVNAETEFPNFKPNTQRGKTLLQRLEYGFDFQLSRSNQYIPGGANIGFTLAYRLNDKSEMGIGFSNQVDLNFNPKFRIQMNSFGLRGFLNWKLRKQIAVYGGYEHAFGTRTTSNEQTREATSIPSALLGLQKKVNLGKGWLKTARLQLLYDWLSHTAKGSGKPLVFRIGYTF
jgi:hypothetical protein